MIFFLFLYFRLWKKKHFPNIYCGIVRNFWSRARKKLLNITKLLSESRATRINWFELVHDELVHDELVHDDLVHDEPVHKFRLITLKGVVHDSMNWKNLRSFWNLQIWSKNSYFGRENSTILYCPQFNIAPHWVLLRKKLLRHFWIALI